MPKFILKQDWKQAKSEFLEDDFIETLDEFKDEADFLIEEMETADPKKFMTVEQCYESYCKLRANFSDVQDKLKKAVKELEKATKKAEKSGFDLRDFSEITDDIANLFGWNASSFYC